MNNNFTDHELIERYLKGDEKSFEVLVARYTDVLYRFVLTYVKDRQVAQDIVQSAFLKVWRNVKKIDKTKNFKSWIYAITKNTALDSIKSKKAVPFSNFQDDKGKNVLVEKLLDNSILPDQLAMASESTRTFKQAIKQLSSKYQEVLNLYYYQYLNFREISEELQESINTIKSRHRRGLILLGKVIAD
jgi:RNA polymerase sigma-70 factor (ECF subfamily)